MHIILRLVGTAAAVLLAAYVVPGFQVESFYTALIVAALLAVIGITLKPILLLLTLPITIITLGLFSFVINAAILWGLSLFVPGFTIVGFMPALLGGLVIAVVQWVLHRFL